MCAKGLSINYFQEQNNQNFYWKIMFFMSFPWSIQMELFLDIIEPIWQEEISIENGMLQKKILIALKSLPSKDFFYS